MLLVQKYNSILENFNFFNEFYLLNDIFVIISFSFILCLINFFYNFHNPLLLILILEIMYLCLNIIFVLSWLHLNFINGTVYVFSILGIAGAETVLGLVIITQLYVLQKTFISNVTLKNNIDVS